MSNLLEKISEALALQKKADRETQCTQIAPLYDGKFVLFEGNDSRAYAVATEEHILEGSDFLIVHASNPECQICFVAVDKCLIKDSDNINPKKCDLALGWDEVFALLDLKLNTGKNRENQTKHIAPGLRTAESFHDQMKGTIGYFQGHLKIPLNVYELRLYVIFPVATITTTIGAELLRFENNIFDIFGLNATYLIVPNTPGESLTPELWL